VRPLRILVLLVPFFLDLPVRAQQNTPPFPTRPTANTQPLIPLSTAPQTPIPAPTPTLVRDPRALASVQTTLNALGGNAALSQVQTWEAQAAAQGINEMASISYTLNWEAAGTEYRIQSSLTGQSGLIVTGHGNPAFVGNGTSSALPTYIIGSLLIPAFAPSILFSEFQDPNHSIEYGGTTTLNSKAVIVIWTFSTVPSANFSVTAQTWYLDSQTGLPDRLEYRIPAMKNPRVWSTGALDFSTWRPVSGVLYPFQITRYENGRKIEVLTIQSATVNATIAPSDFDPPTGGAQ